MLARRESRPLRAFADPMLGMLDSMRDLQQSMSGLFSDLWQGVPAPGFEGNLAPVNSYRRGDDYVVECPLAGVRKDDIDVNIDGDVLTIRATVREREEIKDEAYHLREIRQGVVQRSLRLPFEVEPDKTEAHYQDGLLTLAMHPSEKVKQRGVKVRVQ